MVGNCNVVIVSDFDVQDVLVKYAEGNASVDDVTCVLVDYISVSDDMESLYNILDDFARELNTSSSDPLWYLLDSGLHEKYFKPLGESRDFFNACVSREDRDIPWWLSTFGTFRGECMKIISELNDAGDVLGFLEYYSLSDDSIPYDRVFNISGFDASVYDRVVEEFRSRGLGIDGAVDGGGGVNCIYYYVFVMRDYWNNMVELRSLLFSLGCLNDLIDYIKNYLGEWEGESFRRAFFDGLPYEYQLGILL